MSKVRSIRLGVIVWVQGAVLLLCGTALGDEEAKVLQRIPDAKLFQQFCFDCHAGAKVEGELDLSDLLKPDTLRSQRSTWHKLREVIAFGAMPPEDAKRPSSHERKALLDEIDALLAAYPAPVDETTSITARRLNRVEYNNTVRDLLGVSLRPADDFPSDEVGDGFDNNASVLTLPTLLLEKYFDAAEELADAVIVTPAEQKDLELHKELGGDSLRPDGPVKQDSFVRHQLQPGGSVSGRFDVPATGRYRLTVSIWTEDTSPFDKPLTIRNEQGEVLKSFEFKEKVASRFREEVDLQAGPLTLTAWLPEDAKVIGEVPAEEKKERRSEHPVCVISELQLDGPLAWTNEMLPEAHRRIVIAHPDTKLSVTEAAKLAAMRLVLTEEEVKRFQKTLSVEDATRIVMRSFVRRAFRARVNDEDVEPYVALVQEAVKRGKPYEYGLEVALSAVLVSPRFLYRLESTQSSANEVQALDAYQLASRLSYFLWSSMPDDRLLDLAEQGSLLEPDVVRQEVARMLGDPRADALFENFAAQWLGLRNLATASPDTNRYPAFSEPVRGDMLKETRLVFLEILRSGRSVLDLLDGKSTFLNDRLAKHYGVPGIEGADFRPIDLTGFPRAGLLGQASILTLTSNPGRTSPVKRGKWVMENLLGTPPPDPPANVQSLEESAKSVAHLPLRNQLELHRADPACAACHRYMDAIGFGLENFDGVGQWRDTDQGQPIDNQGDLPDGSRFSGPDALAKQLRSVSGPAFAKLVVDRLLTYALGRGLTKDDRTVIDELIQATTKDNFALKSLVTEVVLSPPFRHSLPAFTPSPPTTANPLP